MTNTGLFIDMIREHPGLEEELAVGHKITPQYKLTNDGAAAVAPSVKWREIDANTPVGAKMLLISKPNGIATVSIRRVQDGWTHWYPIPTFDGD